MVEVWWGWLVLGGWICGAIGMFLGIMLMCLCQVSGRISEQEEQSW